MAMIGENVKGESLEMGGRRNKTSKDDTQADVSRGIEQRIFINGEERKTYPDISSKTSPSA